MYLTVVSKCWCWLAVWSSTCGRWGHTPLSGGSCSPLGPCCCPRPRTGKLLWMPASMFIRYKFNSTRKMLGIGTASRAGTIFSKRSKVRKVTTHFCVMAFWLKTYPRPPAMPSESACWISTYACRMMTFSFWISSWRCCNAGLIDLHSQMLTPHIVVFVFFILKQISHYFAEIP